MISSRGCWNGVRGWLASRLPPYRNSSAADIVQLDLTHRYHQAVLDDPAAIQPEHHVLYDSRFLLTMHWGKLPESVSKRLLDSNTRHRLLVTPYTRYYLPRIVLRSSAADEPDVVLGTPCYADSTAAYDNNSQNKNEFKDASWAHWTFIRRLFPAH